MGWCNSGKLTSWGGAGVAAFRLREQLLGQDKIYPQHSGLFVVWLVYKSHY